MSELGIYEGCYVELRNGAVVGPVKRSSKDMGWPWYINEGAPCWSDKGYIGYIAFHDLLSPEDIVRVMPKDSVKLTMSKTYGDFSKLGKAAIPPHVTKAAMVAGIKANPAYEQFVNAILTAGFNAQYEIEFVPVAEQAPIAVTDELLEQMASVFGDKGFYELGDTAQQKLRGAADCAVAFFGGKELPKNESENRIPDSEKPIGGLSAIPSVREIHDQVLAEVTDWRAKYGRESMPSTYAIAQAFHRMLTPTVSEETGNPFDALKTMEYKSTKE